MKIIQLADKQRYPRMTTSELRETFLIDDLFHPGRIDAVYVDLDRTIIGSAVPLAEPLALGMRLCDALPAMLGAPDVLAAWRTRALIVAISIVCTSGGEMKRFRSRANPRASRRNFIC